jgi:cysteine-rich repeat protein
MTETGYICPTVGEACECDYDNGYKLVEDTVLCVDSCPTDYVEKGTDLCVLCGNGVIDGDEECDDGNQDDGDGCSSTCVEEPGYDCDAGGCYCDINHFAEDDGCTPCNDACLGCSGTADSECD